MAIILGNPFYNTFFAVKEDIEKRVLDPNVERFSLGKEFIYPALDSIQDTDIDYPIIIIRLIDVTPKPIGASGFIKRNESSEISGFKYDMTIWVGIYTKKDIEYNIDYNNDGNTRTIKSMNFNFYFTHEVLSALSLVDGSISNLAYFFKPYEKNVTTNYEIDEVRLLSEISFPLTIVSAEEYIFNEEELIESITSTIVPE